MYTFHPINLELNQEQIEKLNELYADLLKQMERSHVLTPDLFQHLQTAMRAGLFSQPGFEAIWQKAETTHQIVHLLHPNNNLLNLPWRLAVGKRPYLYLSNSLKAAYKPEPYHPRIPLPLKILVMIAAPEDLSRKERLSYEEEETSIIRAFEPLFVHGQVQIDFTVPSTAPWQV